MLQIVTRNDRPIKAGAARVIPLQVVRRYGLMVISFLTLTTPGAAQAACSASRRSAQERTLPFRITSPPFASTVTRLASIAALRRNASSILRLISLGVTGG